ncbi:dCTP deaminase [Acidithiobacillus ferriphilus]|uniref:dCTP deaminase n=1 Tax=Acidithiobacillus ferriphilus TaxID=1689834 RepID=UPI001C07CFDE|nr:dCTP deaminase [Acidithiobacillus ferriphilus]MBU2852963.1 dCTP deaminase [Acidithiobacillus ferriphilus]
MILSNVKIVECLKAGHFSIDGLTSLDPGLSPFNTTSVDLTLDNEIVIPDENSIVVINMAGGGISAHIARNSKELITSEDQPFLLKKGQFILAKTKEFVDFKINGEGDCYSARVEGKSSLARCGILVHFTAPTIHAGFSGNITLEIINLGNTTLMLYPGMSICQLIIEQVCGIPTSIPSQFQNQTRAVGPV